jgi:guanylate kinase
VSAFQQTLGLSRDQVVQFLQQRCIVMVGPSGAGKTTVTEAALARMPHWRQFVTATTRAPRAGETDGVHYHFLSLSQFLNGVRHEQFLEYAEVYGHYYGSPLSEISAAISENRRLILIVDTVGCLTIRSQFPGVPLLGLLPPSMAELRRRIIERGHDDPAQIEQRLALASIELRRIRSFDFAIRNDKLDDAVDEFVTLMRLVETGMLAVQSRVDTLLEQLKENMNEA